MVLADDMRLEVNLVAGISKCALQPYVHVSIHMGRGSAGCQFKL